LCLCKGELHWIHNDQNHFPPFQSAEIKARKRNALEIRLKNEVFFVFSQTEQEKDDWISHIGKAVVKHSSMHVKEDDESDDGA
jgi:hypothetical protein